MKKNKKAFMRILEAFLAVLILLSAILIISSKQDVKKDLSEEIIESQIKVLNIISKNDEIRGWIINYDISPIIEDDQNTKNNGYEQNIKNEITKILPQNLKFAIRICGISDACGLETPYNKEVFVREVLITTTLETYEPKKLRLFVWLR